jgi:NTE family protein
MSLRYRVLALGAGGMRGFLHVGGLLEIERRCGGSLQKQFTNGIYGSSIGSILATAVAFGLNATQIHSITKQCLQTKSFIPSISSIAWASVIQKKGCVPMDTFERIVIEGFQKAGVDLKGKTLGDSKVPLYIVSSNITQGIPAVFQKNVPVLTALKASCCLPGLFQPIIYRDQIYIDGDVLAPVILKVIPQNLHSESLVLNLRQYHMGLTPNNLNELNPLEFMYRIYKVTTSYQYKKLDHKSSIDLVYPGVTSLSELSEETEDDMILTGQAMVRNFFQT